MSITKSLLLPRDRDLTFEERTEAEKIIEEKIGKDYAGWDVLKYPILDLFDVSEGEDGAQPWKYRNFLQEVIKILMLPDNSAVIHVKSDGKAGQYLIKLLEFFECLSDAETQDQLYDCLKYYNVIESMRGDPEKDLYDLWRYHINEKQPLKF